MQENPSLSEAVRILESGNVVGIPTETVYGLAANALNEEAITKIFKIKNRPFFDPLIIHLKNAEEVEKYVSQFPAKARKLAASFWPGPLTLILPKNQNIPDMATSGLSYVGLRVPDHPLTLELLSRLDFPLAAPSANPFGYVSPTTAQHVNDQLGQEVKLILDGGPSRVGLESTIVMFENDTEPVILRLGGLGIEAIEKCIGPVGINIASHSKPHSPGQLDKHYATQTPLIIIGENYKPENENLKIGALTFKTALPLVHPQNQVVLSPDGSLEEAARNLFGAMRKLDSMDLNLILAEKFPETGLGRAINDRLFRASKK